MKPPFASLEVCLKGITGESFGCSAGQVPINPDCVFDASLVRGTCPARFLDLKGLINKFLRSGVLGKVPATGQQRVRGEHRFVFTESMQRLQNVALELRPIALMTGSSKKRRTRRKKTVRT